MRPRAYLISCAPALALLAGAIVLAGFVLVHAGVARDLVVLAQGVVIVAVVLVYAVDYLRKRAFYRDLERYADLEGSALLLAEMVERPDFWEGAVAYDAVRAIAKAANDDVAEHRRQAEEYREYIETWVHEAKSPLAAAHLMLDNWEDDAVDERTFGRLRGLDDELRRVEGYIDQALFYARSEAVERDYLIRRYRLGDLVAHALKANASGLIAAHIAPVLSDLDFDVFTDEKWIEFILGQIIQNSIKYAWAQTPQIAFSGCVVHAGGAREAVELSIADNGCGVTEADLPRVFEKGFTGENGRTGKRATGIGLYLVKRLCDKMGVGVAATSTPGAGFTVTLTFPTNKYAYFE